MGLGVGWRGVGRACRATSRTASSSSLLSKDQIFSHRSGSTTAGWGSAAQACKQGGVMVPPASVGRGGDALGLAGGVGMKPQSGRHLLAALQCRG